MTLTHMKSCANEYPLSVGDGRGIVTAVTELTVSVMCFGKEYTLLKTSLPLGILLRMHLYFSVSSV